MSEPTAQEKQLSVAVNAMRSAITNLSMALEIIGSLHPGPQQEKEEGRKYFGGGAGVRPTAAVGADSQHTEG